MKTQPTVLVTGAAGGIGHALVQAFTAKGYSVLAMDRLVQPAQLSCEQYWQTDLGRLVQDDNYRADQLAAIADAVGANGLHTLVNNAAIQVLGGVDTLSMADWQRTLQVNLLAPFALTQGLLPQLEAARGSVIHISSA